MSDRTDFALRKLPPRPWSVEKPEGFEKGFELGAIRDANGVNVILPWPESAAMVQALPGVLEALVQIVNEADKPKD